MNEDTRQCGKKCCLAINEWSKNGWLCWTLLRGSICSTPPISNKKTCSRSVSSCDKIFNTVRLVGVHGIKGVCVWGDRRVARNFFSSGGGYYLIFSHMKPILYNPSVPYNDILKMSRGCLILSLIFVLKCLHQVSLRIFSFAHHGSCLMSDFGFPP